MCIYPKPFIDFKTVLGKVFYYTYGLVLKYLPSWLKMEENVLRTEKNSSNAAQQKCLLESLMFPRRGRPVSGCF